MRLELPTAMGVLLVAGISCSSLTDGQPQTPANPCTSPTPYAIGSPVNGALASSDCHLGDGSYADFYSFGATATASLRFTLTSGSFDTFLLLYDGAGNVLAVDDDGTGSSNSTLRILLGTAGYQVGANSLAPATSGPYALSSSSVTANVTNCDDVWVTKGISTFQTLAATDCVDASGPFYEDGFLLLLRAGESVTIANSSAAFDAHLELLRIDGTGLTSVASDDDSGPGTDALLTYTAATAGGYALLAGSAFASQTGAYTLTIQ